VTVAVAADVYYMFASRRCGITLAADADCKCVGDDDVALAADVDCRCGAGGVIRSSLLMCTAGVGERV
jgi:hypothetical protein